MLDDEIFPADAPRLDRAAAHGFLRIGDDELGDEAELATQSATGAARALGVVEGEVARREFLEGVAADFAGERLAEGEFAPRGVGGFLREDDGAILAFAEGEFEGVGKAAALVDTGDEAVDHEIDADFLRAGAGGQKLGVIEIFDFAVEADALKAALAQTRKFVAEDGRFRTQRGGEQHDAFAGDFTEDAGDVVVEGTEDDATAVLGATLLAVERPEEAGVVGYLGDGGDGAAGRAAAGALLDGEDGRQAMDKIDVRTLELLQDLAGLGGERLHVFPVALGVDGVEGERRLAGAGRTGDDHELAARDAQLEVLQVVLTGTFDVDVGRGLHAGNRHVIQTPVNARRQTRGARLSAGLRRFSRVLSWPCLNLNLSKPRC